MIPKKAIEVLSNFWPMVMLFCIVIITLRLAYIIINKKPFILYKELMSLSFVVYTLFLFELVTSTDFNSYGNNFILFKEMFRYSVTSPLFYRNVLGNILMFIPFGYFASYYVKVEKVYINVIITFIVSLSIETIQSLIGRSFDIDDIILNIIGGVLGYFIYKLSSKILKEHSINIKNNILVNFLFLIIILILVYLILTLYGVWL